MSSADPEERPAVDQVLGALTGLCEAEEERQQESLEEPGVPPQERERARSFSQNFSEIRMMLQRLEVRMGGAAGPERLENEE